MSPTHTSQVKNPLIFTLPQKHSKAQSFYNCVWVTKSPCDERKFTACHLSSDKSAGKNKSKIGVPTEAVERAPSRDTNCFPPLLCAALTWLKPHTSITSHLNGTSLPLQYLFWFNAKWVLRLLHITEVKQAIRKRQAHYKSAAHPEELSSCWQVPVVAPEKADNSQQTGLWCSLLILHTAF